MSFPNPDQVASWNTGPQPVQQPPAPGRSKTPVIILAVVAVLLAATAGVFTVLYFNEKGAAERAVATRAEKEREAATLVQEAETAVKTREENQSKVDTLQSEHDRITACHDAARGYVASESDSAAEDEWFDKMWDTCRSI